MTPNNDAELRFKATLEDDVSGRADKLEKKLRRMGMSPAEVKMVIKAVDEATPRIKEVQKQVDALPNQTIINIQAQTEQAQRSVDTFRNDVERKPIRLKFVDNLHEVADKIFSLRTKVPLPLAGGVPGMNMLYAGGGAGIGLGAGAAAVGAVQKGVEVNSQMEQSLITLQQTMKDQTKATQEMGALVKMAQKTPFQYHDLLAADVRLRSYAIPTMPGEGGQKGSMVNEKGYMGMAGDMAAAMSTPISQAVEAIADARQGYFVRMMTYGIRMMREDFERGGKYAGMTYEQGLERAIRRFEGAQEMQASSLKGVMSNLKDVFELNILKPIGAPAFGVLKEQATGMQERLIGNNPQAQEFQKDLGKTIQDLQRRMIELYQLLGRGRALFNANIKEPLTEIGKAVAEVGASFGMAFGGTLAYVLQGVAEGLYEIARPIVSIVQNNQGMVQFYGVMKALSALGFSGMSQPFLNLYSYIVPLQHASTGLLRTFLALPGAVAKLFILFNIKKFLDARQATEALNNEFTDLGERKLQKVNAQVSNMAAGLGKSTEEMKKLVVVAGQLLPAMGENERASTAIQISSRAAMLQQQMGADPTVAAQMIAQQVKQTSGPDSSKDIDVFSQRVAFAAQAADAFGMSLRDISRIMVQFGGEMAKVGLQGPMGGSAIAAIIAGIEGGGGVSKGQMDLGMRSTDDVTKFLLGSYARPSLDNLKQVGGPGFRGVGNIWDFENTNLLGLNKDGKAREWRDTRWEAVSRARAGRKQEEAITAIAPDAGSLPRYANPYMDEGMGLAPGRLKAIRSAEPEDRARMLMGSWQSTVGDIDKVNEKINSLTNTTNKLNAETQAYQTALEQLGNVMEVWQRDKLVGLQRRMEDASLSIQQAQLNMRPLERQMTRLAESSGKWGENLTIAQYQMSKFTQGLVLGEQAALDQLHAMELYNKELRLMQLQYSQIGAELGQTTYDAGARLRVEPLANISLAAQADKLQREQAKKQLEYELSYGEDRYQRDQAARSKFQRQEMSQADRLEGIRKNVKVIDEASEQQFRLGRLQFQIQQKMNDANRAIRRQTDHLADLQMEYSRLAQGDKMRSFQDQQFRLSQALRTSSKDLEKAQIDTEKYRDTIESLKGDTKVIQDILFPMFSFSDNKNNPLAALRDIQKLGSKLTPEQGGFTPSQAKSLAKAIDTYEKLLNQQKTGPGRAADWSDTKWTAVISQGVKDGMSGGWFRRFGENITAATGSKGLGTTAAIASTVYAVLTAGGLLRLAAFQTFARGILRIPGAGANISRAAALVAPRAESVAARAAASARFGSNLVAGVAGRLGSSARATIDNPSNILGGRLGPQIRQQFNPFARMRGAIFGAIPGIGPMIRNTMQATPVIPALARGATRLDSASRAGRAVLVAGLVGQSVSRGIAPILGAIRGAPGVSALARGARFLPGLGIAIDVGQATFGSGRTRSRGAGGLIGTGIGGAIGILGGPGGVVAGAAIGGAIGSAAGHFWPEIKKLAIRVGKAIARIPTGIWDWVKAHFKGDSVAERIGYLIGSMIRGGIRIWYEKIPSLILAIGKTLLDWSLKVNGKVVDFLADFGSGLLGGINDLAVQIKNGVGDFFGGIWDRITESLPGAVKKLLGIDDNKGGGSSMPTPSGAVIAGARGVADVATGIWGGITGSKAGGEDYVPRDSIYRVHEGEKIVTKARAEAERRANLHPAGTWSGKNHLLSSGEKEDLNETDKLRVAMRQKINHARKVGENADSLYKQLVRLDQDYHEKYEKYTDDKLKKDVRKRKDYHKTLSDDQLRARDNSIKTVDEQFKKMGNSTDAGFKRIHELTDKWLEKIHHRINATMRSMGVSVSTSKGVDTPAASAESRPDAAGGFAHGGIPQQNIIKGYGDGKGRLYRAGEEADEVIIPLVPHRRQRAISLAKMTLARLGATEGPRAFANGGYIREASPGKDMAYLTARGAYSAASQAMAFASGGELKAGANPDRLSQERYGAFTNQSPYKTRGRRYAWRKKKKTDDFDSVSSNIGAANGGFLGDLLAFANGGVVTSAQRASAAVLGSKPGFAVLMEHFKKIAGSDIYVMSGIRPGSRVAGSGRTSNHASGDAIDISNPVSAQGTAAKPPPRSGLDRLYPYIQQKIPRPPLRDLLWRTSQGGNHFNHIHMGMDPSVTGSLAAAQKFVAALGSDVDISSLAFAGGGGGGNALAGVKLPPVPKELKRWGISGQLFYKALQNTRKQMRASAGGMDAGQLGAFSGGGTSAANRLLGKRMAAALGWTGKQWEALDKLWRGESGWDHRIANLQGSGAYGIPQALPASKMASAGKDWKTNPATQIKWGLNYIKDRYGSPAAALAFWNSKSPHWYHNPMAKHRIGHDQIARLEPGNVVLGRTAGARAMQGPGGEETAAERKLRISIEEMRDAIVKAEKHLRVIKDKDDKKKEEKNLAELNARLRRSLGRQEQQQATKFSKGIMGDLSGGEGTEKLVRQETQVYKGIHNQLARADKALVTFTNNLAKSAKSLLDSSKPGTRARVLARRAVTATRSASRAARRVVAFTSTKKGKAAAREVSRNRYLTGAARRGVNADLIKLITGRSLSRKVRSVKGVGRISERQAYERAAKARPGSTAATKAMAALRKVLNAGLSKNARHLIALRTTADRRAKAALAATRKAAAAQGKRIDASGKLIRGALNRTSAASTKRLTVAQKQAAAKAAAANKRATDTSTKHITKTHKAESDKRSKAEIHADRRERAFQNKATDLLTKLLQKDTNVNIQNKAIGASLSSSVHVRGGRRR